MKISRMLLLSTKPILHFYDQRSKSKETNYLWCCSKDLFISWLLITLLLLNKESLQVYFNDIRLDLVRFSKWVMHLRSMTPVGCLPCGRSEPIAFVCSTWFLQRFMMTLSSKKNSDSESKNRSRGVETKKQTFISKTSSKRFATHLCTDCYTKLLN